MSMRRKKLTVNPPSGLNLRTQQNSYTSSPTATSQIKAMYTNAGERYFVYIRVSNTTLFSYNSIESNTLSVLSAQRPKKKVVDGCPTMTLGVADGQDIVLLTNSTLQCRKERPQSKAGEKHQRANSQISMRKYFQSNRFDIYFQ